MKKEKDDATENAENKPAAPGKAPVRAKKEKKQPNGARLPLLIEFTYTISTLILVLLALTIIVISFLTGASLFALVLRTGVAIVVMGGLLMLISSQIASGLLFSVKVDQEEAQKMSAEEPVFPANNEDLNKAEA